MKKIRCLLWLMLFGLNLQAQTRIDTTYYDSYGTTKRIRSIKVVKGNKAEVVVFNQRGQKTESYSMLDGKKSGKYISYTDGGKPGIIAHFQNDLKNGEEILFYNTGQMKSSIQYVGNYPMGKFKIWNEAGVLIQKGSYDTLIKVFANRPDEVNKVLTGKYEAYFQNGKKEKECFYVKGKLHGISKEWYRNGSLKSVIEYQNGLVYGKELTWFENGKKHKVGEVYYYENIRHTYVKPRFNGKQLQYYENGKVRLVQPYKDYLPHGKWIEYSEQGVVLSEKNYVRGQIVGDEKTYYANGILREKIPYQMFKVNGRDTALMHGIHQSFFSNGKVNRDMNYVQGIPYGLLTMYFENGAVERQLFVLGKLDNYALLKEYSKDAKLLKLGTYEVNEKDTMRFSKLIYETYNEEGLLQYKVNHRKAKANGAFESYYENGNLLSEAYIFSSSNNEYMYKDALGTSWQVFYYPNGALRYETFTVNNYPHGHYMEWFPDGNLKRFIDRAGLDVQWLQDGSLMCYQANNNYNNLHRDTVVSESWLNQLYVSLNASTKKNMRLLKQADGPQNSFYANGKKHMETFVKGGKFDTYYLVYSFKGDTLVYFELKDGLLHGKYLIKNEDGSLHTSGFYEEGTEVGEWKIHGVRGIPQRHFEYDRNANSGDKKYTYEFTFYENGNLEKKSYFKDGLLQDWVISFHPNGLIKDSIFFVNDTLNGKYVSYTDEGKLYSIRYFEKGKRVGWGQDWYYKTDGKGIMREEQYKNGIRDGLARYYHKNGNLHLLAYFKDGKEDSTWMYYDSLGVLTNTVYHKMGVKKEVPLVGPCSCRDKARSKGFAQSLSGLLNDETDINLWQFPFHESITPILDQSFFRNLQTDNNRRSSFYSFDLITFKPIQIGIPGKSGIKLWLNPCLHDGEESSLDIGLNFTQKKPDETRVEIGSNRIAYILPTRFFKSINAAPKEVLAHVKLNYLVYSQKGIEFKDAHSICMDKAFLLNSNYTLNIDTFSLLDIDPSPQHSDLRYLTFYNYNLLGKEMVKALQDDPIFIYEAKGSLQLVYNRKSIKADVSQLLVSNKVVAGFLSIPKVEAKDAQLYYSDGFAQFVINEKALYQQMKQDGFTKVYGAYNPKEKVLEILFYIHKP